MPDKTTLEELCCTVFYLSRYAECMEMDGIISVPDERELFWCILEWAQKFEQSYDPGRDEDYQAALEASGPQWLLETFPYDPSIDETPAESIDSNAGMIMPGI